MKRYLTKPMYVQAWPWPWKGLQSPHVAIRDDGYGDPCATVMVGRVPMFACKGDWIIREPDGTYRPVRPVVFDELYEEAPVDADTSPAESE